jgi:phosphopantetheinyl transferase (holo-ACP synthase)
MHSIAKYSFSLSDGHPTGKENCNYCLSHALRGLIGPYEETELEISNYYNLKQYPEIVASLSHSKNIGAALLAPIEKYPSVGIDIELKERKITIGAEKYFFNEHDRPGSDPLLVWTKKEAAFKALYPLISKFRWKKELLLKHIWIKGDKFGLMGRKKVLGKIIKLERNLGNRTVLISLALLKAL